MTTNLPETNIANITHCQMLTMTLPGMVQASLYGSVTYMMMVDVAFNLQDHFIHKIKEIHHGKLQNPA